MDLYNIGESFYMTGLATVCWAIWKNRNNICFEGKLIRHPCDVIFQACSFLNYWSALLKTDFQDIVKTGAKAMLQAAMTVMQHQGRCVMIPVIQDAGQEEDQNEIVEFAEGSLDWWLISIVFGGVHANCYLVYMM